MYTLLYKVILVNLTKYRVKIVQEVQNAHKNGGVKGVTLPCEFNTEREVVGTKRSKS